VTTTQAAPVTRPADPARYPASGRPLVGGVLLATGDVHLGPVSADPQVVGLLTAPAGHDQRPTRRKP
jgi:hypothetical protein